MKIEIRVSIKEGYTTIGGETVEVECDNLDSPLKVEQALKSALDLAEEKGMFRRGPAHALDLYLKMREKQIEDEVDKRHRMDKAPDPKTWELQSTITSLREENATIERRAVDRPATAADMTESSVEIRETAEQAVVAKTARVVEEVVVGKESTTRPETINATVRGTQVEVERVEGTPTTAAPLDPTKKGI